MLYTTTLSKKTNKWWCFVRLMKLCVFLGVLINEVVYFGMFCWIMFMDFCNFTEDLCLQHPELWGSKGQQ